MKEKAIAMMVEKKKLDRNLTSGGKKY